MMYCRIGSLASYSVGRGLGALLSEMTPSCCEPLWRVWPSDWSVGMVITSPEEE